MLLSSDMETKLKCDMTKECAAQVTHIDAKGYLYCAAHGAQRRSIQRCRALTPRELAHLRNGTPIRY